jgi:hypothetical protein
MNMFRIRDLLVGACFTVGAGYAQAHHSAAMFDEKKCITLTGALKKINMSYPHVWLWVEVPDGKGKSVTWTLEATDPATLRAKGWQRTSVKVGDSITILANPVRDGRAIAGVSQARLPDGRVIGGGPERCKFPAK